MRFLWTIVTILFVEFTLFSQQKVSGTISDELGNPLPGVIVRVKGLSIETVSDKDGIYSIDVPSEQEILTFTKSGYEGQEIAFSEAVINIIIPKVELDLFNMSLDELMNVKVISVSATEEKMADAPATTIVLSAEDLKKRGYTDISEIFDDLPGMQIVRTYGDTYYKNYWRGYRNTIGSPFLIMVDGVILNTLYFGITTPMATLPVSNIDKIEIVYGPVSSVYGANAFMGVINIITINDKKKNGSFLTSKMSSSELEYNYLDINYFYKRNNLRISLTGHVENGDLRNRIDNNSFYWLKDEHYADELLWGNYVNNPMISEKQYSSYLQNHSLDLRIYAGNTEFAAQYSNLNTGYGTSYPADRIMPKSTWPRIMSNLYFRHKRELTEKLTSKTLVRYRSDGVDNSSYDLEGFNITNTNTDTLFLDDIEIAPGETKRILQHSTWYTKSWSASIFQDFEAVITKRLFVNAGLKYEYKDLQKAYNLNSVYTTPALADATKDYAPVTTKGYEYQNRIIWQDHGAYLQANYQLNDNNKVNLGVRVDKNSAYGTYTSLRANYITTINRFNLKLLYGEAFKEPSPRSLYGGWSGSGSDPDLKPENSKTYEASITYATKNFSSLVSTYYVNNTNTIITHAGGAENLGTRNVFGLDYHLQAVIPVNFIERIKFWAYYSGIFLAEEEEFDEMGTPTGKKIDIGDLSKHSIYFGFSSEIIKNLSLTVYGRSIGERKTISTNPVEIVDPYFTIDGNLSYSNFLVEGIGIGIRVTNILDAQYYHPGVREADAGIQPGYWENGIWNGSQGWFNSLLPQPRRFITFYLTLDI